MTYILTWNPSKFNWEAFADGKPTRKPPFYANWTCRSTRPEPGDRFIMLRLGSGNRNGIVATGQIVSFPYTAVSWEHKTSLFIDILIEVLFENEYQQHLLKDAFPEQCWSPQSSGISLKTQYEDSFWNVIETYRINPSANDMVSVMNRIGIEQ